jgi:DNA polymerase
MDSSLNSTRLQKTEAEILSLLDVLSDKVDLERKLGVDYVQLAPIDTHNERKMDELSKSEKTKELSKLEKQVKKCTKCELCKGRTNVVFGVGDPDADLMFVGEAPGYYEDVQGEPFVGRAGQLLTKIIESIGLKREEVYIANILKCRPPENRNPNAKEIVLCTPHLIKQVEIIRPKVICALGTFAAQTLLDTKEAIGKLRGKFFEYQGTKFLPTYHPAYLLRNPNDKKKVWSDIKKVRDYLKK